MTLNLNLLHVIVALAEEGTVSAAARKLRISQPSLSNALARLRQTFSDPLFVRTARGMEPTPRAQALLQPVRLALGVIENEVLRNSEFDPATNDKTISLALSDVGEIVLLPDLLSRLSREAPAASVRAVSLPLPQLERAMEFGDVDLAVGYLPDFKGNNFYQQRLFSHGFICLLRAQHPIKGSRLTLKQFKQLGHAVVRPEGRSQEDLERFLSQHGVRRRVVVHTPHFLSIPHIIARSDLVAMVPRAVGTALARFVDIRLVHPPFELPGHEIRQHWHRKFQHDTRHRWLREMMHSLFNDSADGRTDRNPGRIAKPGSREVAQKG